MSDTTDFRDALRSKQARYRHSTTGMTNSLNLTDDASNADASWRRARRSQAAELRSGEAPLPPDPREQHESLPTDQTVPRSAGPQSGTRPAPAPSGGAPTSQPGTTHGERWLLGGPGVRELPSPEYMALLDEQQPGTLTAVMGQVTEDIEYRRRVHRDRTHRDAVHASVRAYSCLTYAIAALGGCIALFVMGHVRPGVLLAILSAFALVIATDAAITTPLAWFKGRKAAENKPKPTAVRKPGSSAPTPVKD